MHRLRCSHLPIQRLLVNFVVVQVAESNTAAAMYSRAGFHVVKRTRDDWTAPLMHLILHSFLGYGAWHRMVKVSLLLTACSGSRSQPFQSLGCSCCFQCHVM